MSIVLDLGEQPLAEQHTSDAKLYPLRLAQCARCGLVQLADPVNPVLLFPPDHLYSSGNSAALREHFSGLADTYGEHLQPDDLVVDIGANDGTLLLEFGSYLLRVGVEPTRQIAKSGPEIATVQDWWSADLAGQIRDEYGPAKLITACNVLAHVADPHDAVDGIRLLLADDGVLVVEVHDLRAITTDGQWDTVYHEHRWYWSTATIRRLLDAHGLDVHAVIPVDTHGGSLRVVAGRPRLLKGLQQTADDTATDLYALLARIRSEGGTIYGIGATTRATPVIWKARIASMIDRVCEIPGSDKIGTRMPGTVIPVVDEVELVERQPSHALIFAWHMADRIIGKLNADGYRGKYIVPLPTPRVLDGAGPDDGGFFDA